MKNQFFVSAKTRTVFIVFWGLSVYFHIVSEYEPLQQIAAADYRDPAFWFGLESLVLGLAVLFSIFWTQDGRFLVVIAILQLINSWMLAPFIDNHWTLGAMVSVAILLSAGGASFPSKEFGLTWSDRFFRLVIPATLLILVASYPFAAFAKWNSAFLNPEVSCAVDLFVRGYELFGLDRLTQIRAVRWGLIIIGLASETLIAVVILIPKTRRWGAMLGLFFHFTVAFDPIVTFFDFSSILFLFFVLCLPQDTIDYLVDRAESQFEGSWKKSVVAGLMALILFAPLIEHVGGKIVFVLGGKSVWLFFSGTILVWVFKGMVVAPRKLAGAVAIWPEKQNGAFGKTGKIVLAIVLVCTLSIGLSPWLELQTGYGLVMYSNLRTAGGQTNHLIIPKTLPIGHGYSDLVTITAADDDVVHPFYVGSDWQIPAVTVRRTLAQYPNIEAEIVRNGTESSFSAEPDLFQPLPYFQRKFQNLRPVDLREPVRCQLSTFPLHSEN